MADFLTEAFLRMRDRVRGLASVEDALQDAFVKLWGRYQPASGREAEALLRTTVRNTSVDMFRRRRELPAGDNLPENRPGLDANPVEVQEREAMFQKVEELIRKDLTDIQKYIIRRHEYEGAKLETVAKELGMKAPAVRMQLSRARKTIRERYNEQELL